jgi:hypothetical protein
MGSTACHLQQWDVIYGRGLIFVTVNVWHAQHSGARKGSDRRGVRVKVG